jgi:hypothetical protein
MLVFSSLSAPTGSVAQTAPPPPVLLNSVVGFGAPDAILVRGEGFTEGGEVFFAILDPLGERSYETRWTTASEPTFDMLGHDDPALGYRPGGAVLEWFENLCGQQVMIRAYDQATTTWTNVIDVTSAC